MAASGKAITVRLVGDSTDFSISLTKAQLKLLELKGSADSLTRTLGIQAAETKKAAKALSDMGSAAHGSVSGMQASSAAIRLLESNTGGSIRAAERFIGMLPGVSTALKAAFPVIGAIALIDVFARLGEHIETVKKAFDDLKDGPSHIAGAFNQITAESIKSGDSIAVTNAKLQESINKLQGKPSNGIALAIAEAKQRADELSASLTGDIAKIQEILTKETFSGFSFQSIVGGQAPTAYLQDQFKQYSQKNTSIQFEGQTKSLAGDKTASTVAAEKQLVNTRQELTFVTNELAKAQANQAKIEEFQAATAKANTGVYDAAASAKYSALADKGYGQIQDQKANIATLQGFANNLMSTLANAKGSDEKVGLEGKEHSLQIAKEQADAYRAVTKTLEELQAKIKGVSQETAASTPVEMAHAKAFAESEQVISRLRESLAEHALTLKASDAAQIRSMETTLADLELQKATDAEFKKTIDGINEKIDAYQRLTAAIGAGYAAQRQASVQDAVEKASIGKNYSPAQKAAIGNAAGAEFDAGNSQKTGADLDKLQEKTSTENALAAATLHGGEAVREAALGMEIQKIAAENSTASAQKLIAATLTLASAEEKLKVNASIERLTQETAAQERLNTARLQGADAVRAAQLANSISDIKSNTAAGPDQDALIQAATAKAQVAEQTRLLDLATRIDFSNKTKLEDLDKELALMKQIGASEMAIKETEAQRTELLDKIALQSGSMADVLRVAADRMAEAAQNVRESIVESIAKLQDGINAQIGKMAVGEKTDWAKMFKQQGSSGIQSSLKAAEGFALSKLGLGGKRDGSSAGAALFVQMAGIGGGLGGGLKIPGLSLPGSDGSTPLAADGLPINPGTITAGLGDLSQIGAGASSGIMGLLSKLAGKFAGGFATGGDIPGGSTALVGENGPELIRSGSAGDTVTPNSALGGVTNHYTIDARNSDAAAVEQRVRIAIAASGAQSVSRAYQATAEHARRNPK